MESVTPAQLNDLIDDPEAEIQLVDVREQWEVDLCQIENSIHIPMANIPASFHLIEFNLPIVVYCHHGMRSLQVAQFLENGGYIHVLNLLGGIDAWAREIDPQMKSY